MLQEYFTQKWKFAENVLNLRAFKDIQVCFSFWTDLEKCSIPLQWMGAVRMRVQTADKNITILHTTPVHQLTCEILWSQKLRVYKKQIHN